MVTGRRRRDLERRVEDRRDRATGAADWEGPVLAVRASSLGDVLLALAAVRELKRLRPDLDVDLLTRPAYADLAALAPSVRRVVTADDRRLSGEGYGVLWDLQGGAKGRRLARGVDCRRRIGFPASGLHRRLLVLFGRRIPPPPHLLSRFLASVLPGAREVSVAEPWLRVDGEVVADLVGLAPQARHAMKEIPVEILAHVASRLAREGRRAIWFLDPSRPVPEALAGGAQEIVRAPLREVAREMARCATVVAADTGLAHLAAALGRPVVVLFGSTVPELGYTPAGRHAVVEVDLPCRPCHVHGANRCWLGHRRCLRELDAQAVGRRIGEVAGNGERERAR